MRAIRIWIFVALGGHATQALARLSRNSRFERIAGGTSGFNSLSSALEEALSDGAETGPAVDSVATGSTEALSEEGYARVAALHSDQEMETFVRRILASEGKKVLDTEINYLHGFIPYFSGTQAVQSLKQLRTELDAARWVTRESNLEVDMALDTLRNERPSSLSNVSAYALAIANAMSLQEGEAKPRIIVESELRRKPISVLSAELREVSAENAKVVLQREDGTVSVVEPDSVALDFARMPLEKWNEQVNEARDEKLRFLKDKDNAPKEESKAAEEGKVFAPGSASIF